MNDKLETIKSLRYGVENEYENISRQKMATAIQSVVGGEITYGGAHDAINVVAPDGRVWTGFATLGADGKSAYALLFRELNGKASFKLDFGSVFGGARFARAEVIGGRGTAALEGDGTLAVEVPSKLDFVWVKLGK